MKRLAVLLCAAACSPAHETALERPDELAACQLISKSGDAIAECLIMKYSWRAESASTAKYDWQRYLDSLRLDHEQQVATLIAEQEAERRRVAAERRAARLAALTHAASPWAACIREQWHADGTNWSFKPCQRYTLPSHEQLDAYISTRQPPAVEVGVLHRAHMAAGLTLR